MTDILDDIKQRLEKIGFKDAKIEKCIMEVRNDWKGERPYISTQYEYRREMSARNRAIIRDYKNGESIELIARRYGISRQRVHKIITG